MIEFRRLTAAGALLAIAAVLTSSTVWGDPAKDKEIKKWREGGELMRPQEEGDLIKPVDDDTAVDEGIVFEKNRFADVPLITYQTPTGDLHFALPSKKEAELGKAASLYQSRVRTLTSSGVDLTTQAVLSADRRSVTLSVKPVFNTANLSAPVKVPNPVVPGE